MCARIGTTLAWSLWLATFGCCAAGLAVTLAVTRPLTLGVLVGGASALSFSLSRRRTQERDGRDLKGSLGTDRRTPEVRPDRARYLLVYAPPLPGKWPRSTAL